MRTNCCWTDLSLVSPPLLVWTEIGTILTHLKITPLPSICHHLTSSARPYLKTSNFLNDDGDDQFILRARLKVQVRSPVLQSFGVAVLQGYNATRYSIHFNSIYSYSLGSMNVLPNTRIHYLLSMFFPRDKLSLSDLGCFQKLLSGDILCRLNTNE